MSNQNDQQAPMSWLQSSNGEWLYFLDESLTGKNMHSVIEQDYIWLVSQTTYSHKISGYRIANETIESLIAQLAGVAQVVVYGVPHEKKGNAIHVYIELNRKGIALTTLSDAINVKLASYLGDFACAEVIKYVEQLPETNNKILARKILKSENITMNYAA